MTRSFRTPLGWLGALLAVYLTAPILAFIVRLGRHGAPSPPGLASALGTSLLTATISTALIALLGIPLAYMLARSRGPFAALVTVLVALPLALPPLMSGILLLYLVGPYTFLGRLFGGGLTDSLAGIVIAQTFVAAPFLVITARAAFAAVDPELDEVARTLGRGTLARFWTVALAVAWPGVQAGLLLAWLRAFGEFGATLIVAYHPYSLPVYTFVQFDSSGLNATIVPVAVALAAALVVLVAAMTIPNAARRRARAPARGAAPTPAPATGALAFSVHKRIGAFSLELDHAGATRRLAILGASGAGKTLALRVLAGITDAEHAQIRLDGAPLESTAAEKRRVGYVPQHSALVPRRSVWQQLMLAVDADPALASWWLDRLGLHGLENRQPQELSGGQRRRVALARALARDPSLVLLDEPFSALDAPVRSRLWREMRGLQREVGFASVTVTHDPEEAALLADELLVLDAGRVIQQGPTHDVLSRPASPRVAALLGIPNTARGRVTARGRISSGELVLDAPADQSSVGREVLWSVRPECVRIADAGAYRAIVQDAVAFGGVHELRLRLASLDLTMRSERPQAVAVGSECRIDLPREAIMVWPADAQRAAESSAQPPM